MQVIALPKTGNSSKFLAKAKNGDFTVALSFTLRTKVWELADEETELAAAQDLAEAIVSRHDPKFPLNKLYVFAEHNSEPTFQQTLQKIRKHGYGHQL